MISITIHVEKAKDSPPGCEVCHVKSEPLVRRAATEFEEEHMRAMIAAIREGMRDWAGKVRADYISDRQPTKPTT